MRLLSTALGLVAAFAMMVSCVPDNTKKGGSGGAAGSGSGGSNGGSSGSGGSSQPPTGSCDDTSTFTGSVKTAFDHMNISVANNANKTYCMISNWWNKYNGETETINGLGFTVGNPNKDTSTNNNPLGFPTVFIGNYSSGSCTSKGSNLPKKVSDLTSIPTVFTTNASAMGYSNYNATYDVWFSATSSGVSGSNPGKGGAYLMVWLFMPTDRQPRGQPKNQGRPVPGLPSSWDVWVDNSTDPPCISYVSNDKLSSLEFDLNDVIQDAVAHSYGVTSSQYLSLVFGGFEVWGGADGVQLQKFCVNVE